MDKVRVGVVGLGYWGPNLARNFDRLSGAELAYCCDLDRANLERARKLYPAATVTDDYAQLLADDALDAVVAELAASRPENWLTNVLTMAQSFAADLRKAFDLERKVYREMPGISPAERACVEDMIAAGYPGEGHRLSKYTHGAPAQSDGVHFWRSVSRHMAYTLRAGAGARRLRFEAAGAGRLTLSTSAGTLLRREWSGGEGWETREEKFVSPGGEIEMRVERVASSRPEIGLVYLLSGDA